MKTYSVPRPGQGFIWEDGKRRVLPHRLDLRNHSPTGFAYGYRGSGPAQLALAILCDVLKDDERALALYQRFKEVAIGAVPEDQPFEMTEQKVLDHVARIVGTEAEA